jgi:transcription initiation factor TFIID subunit TAF12
VLSKRKLDELVRQVTGGSEEALTPEVEEVSAPLPLNTHEHPH